MFLGFEDGLEFPERDYVRLVGFHLEIGNSLGGVGAGRADAVLFGEDASRIVVGFQPAQLAAVQARCAALGVDLTLLGQVGGERLVLRRAAAPGPGELLLDLPVSGLRLPWVSALPAVVGEAPDGSLLGAPKGG